MSKNRGDQVMDAIMELIQDLLSEGSLNEDILIYVSDDAYRWMVDDSVFQGIHQTRIEVEDQERVGMKPSQSGSSWTGDNSEMRNSRSCEVVKFNGTTVIESPWLRSGRIVALDMGEVRTAPEGMEMDVFFRDPSKIKSFNVRFERSNIECSRCGSSPGEDEIMVEGDDGELYCSLKCLNEVYAT